MSSAVLCRVTNEKISSLVLYPSSSSSTTFSTFLKDEDEEAALLRLLHRPSIPHRGLNALPLFSPTLTPRAVAAEFEFEFELEFDPPNRSLKGEMGLVIPNPFLKGDEMPTGDNKTLLPPSPNVDVESLLLPLKVDNVESRIPVLAVKPESLLLPFLTGFPTQGATSSSFNSSGAGTGPS